jgi:hypothetical protein
MPGTAELITMMQANQFTFVFDLFFSTGSNRNGMHGSTGVSAKAIPKDSRLAHCNVPAWMLSKTLRSEVKSECDLPGTVTGILGCLRRTQCTKGLIGVYPV